MKSINEYFSQDEKISLISEYLLGKAKTKINSDVEDLLKSLPETIKCNNNELEIEFDKLIGLGYVPVKLTPFTNNSLRTACFYLFKKPKADDYALVSVCPRYFTSYKESVIISYTNKKENVEIEEGDSSIPVSMKWRNKHSFLINMQENTYTCLYMINFGDYDDIKDKNQWWAKGSFCMMSTQKSPKKIYDTISFWK